MSTIVPVAIGAYLAAGLFHAIQRLGRDPSHPDRLRAGEYRQVAIAVVCWLPVCLVAAARYARVAWRASIVYLVADAGAPLGLFIGIVLIATLLT